LQENNDEAFEEEEEEEEEEGFALFCLCFCLQKRIREKKTRKAETTHLRNIIIVVIVFII